MRLSLGALLVASLLQLRCNTTGESLTQFLDQVFEARVARSPMFATRLNRKTNYDKWDDISDDFILKEAEIASEDLRNMERKFNYDKLSAEDKVSYRVFRYEAHRMQEQAKYVQYDYPVNQMFGWQSGIASFLFNNHRIDNLKDAQDYVARLRGIPHLMNQLLQKLDARAAKGIMPPKFVYPMCISDCENLVANIPTEEGGADELMKISGNTPNLNPFLSDFYGKIDAVKSINDADRFKLKELSRYVMVSEVRPAYEKLISKLEELQKKATDDAGVWKFPDGYNYYAQTVRQYTTTGLSPEQVHQIGLQEVARIQAEMDTLIKTQIGYKGTLQQFFEKMRRDTSFYYPNTPSGKIQYINEATAIIHEMRGKLDQLFITKPKSAIEVRQVEAYRERSAGKAFYEIGSPDGKRPGYYYANTFNMSVLPRYQMRALAYHEGIPGHHMQLSLAQEMQRLPQFRRYADFGAYTEGWGLYCEFLPKEYGMYPDPYSDFGRLAMELFRAVRLVVDTGIHSQKWTREQAIAYYIANTPNSEADCTQMVNRHIVMPGQATAYKIGMMKIVELRENTRQRRGSRFDIRRFHDVVLSNGPLPLDILAEVVRESL